MKLPPWPSPPNTRPHLLRGPPSSPAPWPLSSCCTSPGQRFGLAPLPCPFSLPPRPASCTPRQAPCLCLGPRASHPPREKSQVLSFRGLSRFSRLHPTLGPQHTNTLSVCHHLSLSPPKSPADPRSGHTQPSREAAMFMKHYTSTSVDLIPYWLHP